MPNHFMIDIETWDTAPSAVVRAIAILDFDLTCGPEMIRLIDCRSTIDEQIEAGRTVSAETVAWWAKQPHKLATLLASKCDHYADTGVYEAEFVMPDDLADVVGNVSDAVWTEDRDIRVWSRGHFDIAILEHLLQSQKYGIPWRYSQVRDVRSLDEITPPPESNMPHHPLADCLAQIHQVCEALRKAGTEDLRAGLKGCAR